MTRTYEFWVRAVGRTLLTVGLLSFIIFCAVALKIGGSFDQERSKDGHYYVSAHGRSREVSRDLYEYSRRHSYSMIATFPLAFVGFIMLAGVSKRGFNGTS